MRGFMFGKSHVHGFQLKHPRYAPASMLIDPLVIGEFETVLDGPMAFSSEEPVAYATGSPTAKVKEFNAFRVAPTASRGFDAPKQRVLLRPETRTCR